MQFESLLHNDNLSLFVRTRKIDQFKCLAESDGQMDGKSSLGKLRSERVSTATYMLNDNTW
jgi:hypothetical protein